MAHIKGVDFSHWQANVDFEKLANHDIKFAIFKAGEIPTSSKQEFTDELYTRNISEAKRHGIISGAYYFFHPSISASRQARHFDAVMQRDGQPDLPPVIDIEDTDQREPEVIAAALKAMSDALIGRGYRIPIIYSRWGFLVNQVGEPFWIKDHLLWLAQYSNNLVHKPADMRNVIIWQYTDRLKLPGIGVALDGNYWLKSEAELLQLVKKPGPVVQQPPPEPSPEIIEEEPVPEENAGEIIPVQTPLQPTEPEASQPPEAPTEELQVPDPQPRPDPLPEPTPIEAPEQEPDKLPEEPPEFANASKANPGIWESIMRLIREIIKAWR